MFLFLLHFHYKFVCTRICLHLTYLWHFGVLTAGKLTHVGLLWTVRYKLLALTIEAGVSVWCYCTHLLTLSLSVAVYPSLGHSGSVVCPGNKKRKAGKYPGWNLSLKALCAHTITYLSIGLVFGFRKKSGRNRTVTCALVWSGKPWSCEKEVLLTLVDITIFWVI